MGKQLNDALKDAILDQSPAMIAFHDRPQSLVWGNASYCRAIGSKAEDISRHECFTAFGFHQPCSECPVVKAAETGQPAEAELFPDHAPRPDCSWLVQAVPVTDAHGRNLGLVEIVTQKPGQSRPELELRQERKLLQAIIDNIPVMITRYYPESNLLYLNKEFESVVGWNTQEARTLDLMEKIYPNPKLRQAAQEYMNKASVEWQEFQLQARSGELIDSQWSNILLDDGTQIGIGLDIRDRKRAERELKENQLKLQTLIDQTSEMLFLHDFDGHILDVNQRSVEQSGYSKEELLTMQVSDLDPDYHEREEQGIFWSRLDLNRQHSFEARHQRKDGTIVPVEVTVSKIMLGNDVRIMALARDISDRKRYENLLIQAKEQAEVANRAKSEFLANMSHEIRTPLNGVKGMIELASRKASHDEVRKYLDLAGQSADHLMCIINDVIDLSKIEAGHIELHPQPFSLRECLQSTFFPLQASAEAKGLDFSLEVAPEVPDGLVGDVNRFRQVLENIVGNAVKFTHEGRISVSVQLLGDSTQTVRLLCTVQDTGIGISEENQKVIFQSFTQIDPSIQSQYGGSGLGLAISRQYLEMMDGGLWCTSREGQGSTFTLTAAFDRFSGPLPKAAPEGDTSQSRSALKILVAEDSAMNRIYAEQLLKDMGHTVVLVEDGRLAVQALSREHFDLVLMDIRMPNLDGQEALRIIRQNPPTGTDPSIPVIALTAYALKEDRKRLLELGFDGHLAKPIDVQALGQVVASIEKRKPLA
jgi:PAS domain S-box-containing protein